ALRVRVRKWPWLPPRADWERGLNDRSIVNQVAGANGNSQRFVTLRSGLGGARAQLRSAATADDLLVDGSDHLVEVADDRVVGPLDHRRFLIGVDGHECLRAFDSGHVLDRSGDPAGDVDVRGDPTAGLADLLGVRAPAE